MHLIIDGYNLLHVTRSLSQLSSIELEWERDRLINQLSVYRQLRPYPITVVFDGWQGGWNRETREMKKGIEVIFSKLGEKADEVIRRFIRKEGSSAVVITSDRDISRYAGRMATAVISSDQFREKMEKSSVQMEKDFEDEVEGERGLKRTGSSRRFSKEERRRRSVLKKL